MTKTLPLLLCPLFVFLAGCGKSLPPGTPKLYETVLTITQDNAPLAGADVVVINEEFKSKPWVAGGKTNASGTVSLLTQGKYDGIPAGKYVVVVSKVEKPEIAIPGRINTDEEIAAADKAAAEIADKTFNVVSAKFMSQDTTPLRLEVKEQKNNATLDVSPKVQDKIVAEPSDY